MILFGLVYEQSVRTTLVSALKQQFNHFSTGIQEYKLRFKDVPLEAPSELPPFQLVLQTAHLTGFFFSNRRSLGMANIRRRRLSDNGESSG